MDQTGLRTLLLLLLSAFLLLLPDSTYGYSEGESQLANEDDGEYIAHPGTFELYRRIFDKYDRLKVPKAGVNSPLKHYITVEMKHLSFDPQGMICEFHGQLYSAWTDPNLTWNPEDYGGVDKLLLPVSDIWFSRMRLMFTSDWQSRIHYPPLLSIKMAGKAVNVRLRTRLVARVPCSQFTEHFPHDVYNCTVVLRSLNTRSDVTLVKWTDRLHQLIRVNPASPNMKTTIGDFCFNISTAVHNVTLHGDEAVDYASPLATWSEYHITVTMRRCSRFYFVAVLLPLAVCWTIGLLSLLSPYIPLSLIVNVLDIVIMHLFIHDAINIFPPVIAEGLPFAVQLYGVLVIMIVIFIAIHVTLLFFGIRDISGHRVIRLSIGDVQEFYGWKEMVRRDPRILLAAVLFLLSVLFALSTLVVEY